MNIKAEILAAGVRLKNSGLTVETWGNISVCDRESGLVYITPSGMNYDTMTELDICTVDLACNCVDGCRTPSIETPLHTTIYKCRADVSAVVHTHPIYSTAFSAMGQDIPLFLDEGAQALGDIVRTSEYTLPGTQQLADNCVQALGQKANACLLKSHGAVCVGKTLNDCFKVANVLEMCAHILYLIRSMNGEFHPISSKDIQAMQDFVAQKYGQRNC